MPRLRKLGKGGYYFALFYDARRSPKEKSVPLHTNKKGTATRKYGRLLDDYEAGRYDPWAESGGPARVTVRQASARFLESRSALRPRTRQAYEIAVRGALGALPPGLWLSDVRSAHVRRYVLDASVSPSTRRHRYGHLRTFFNWCVGQGLIEESPLVEIPVPKEQKRLAEFLTPKQLERLLRAIGADYEMKLSAGQARQGEILWLKDLVLVAVSTGMRRAELCNLRWSHVDFESGCINVRNDNGFQTKSGNERSVPMVGDARTVLLRKYVEAGEPRDGYVFEGVGGGQLNGSFASKAFKRYVRLARLPETIRFHSLRHTCASWLVQRGVALTIVQAILGHSTIRVTERYAHLAPDVVHSAMQSAFGSGILKGTHRD